MANNKFLQILRNFQSTTRAQAIAKLDAAASSDTLFHAGTPVVAFYSTADSKTFAYRSAPNTYGADVTKNYSAVFGIMGEQQGDIEIFDIQTSVEDLIGGASEFTTAANSVFPSKTWDCRSLGGIQVVLEDMEGILTTEIGNLKTRIDKIHTIMGQPEETYTTPSGSTYLGDATSLQGEINALDSALAGLADRVSANRIVNNDGTIDVQSTTVENPETHEQEAATAVGVIVKSGEKVIAKNGNNGLYTDIKIARVVASGQGAGDAGAPAADEIVGTIGTNVKEAFALKATDGTMLGNQINIYKDSSLTDVFVGHVDDTFKHPITGQTTVTDSYTNKSTDVTDGTGEAALVFVYHKEDGNYELVAVESGAFLTESEFSDGLQVNNHVVSVKKDTNSGKVRIADGDSGLVDVLTVSSNGVKVDNIQAAINYAVTNATADLAISAEGDNYITAAVDASDNKKINVTADVQSLTATAGTAATYNSTTGEQTAAGTAGTLSGTADSLADGADIASKVKTYVDGAIAIEAARNDAKNVADIYALNGTADVANAASGYTPSVATGDFEVLTKVVETGGKIIGVGETNGSTSTTLKKVAATGAAADVSYDDTDSGMGTDQNPVATVQDAIEKLDTRIDALGTDALEGVTSGNTGIVVGTKENHSQTLTLTLDETSTSASSPQAITGSSNVAQITRYGLYVSNVWDCGEYTVS